MPPEEEIRTMSSSAPPGTSRSSSPSFALRLPAWSSTFLPPCTWLFWLFTARQTPVQLVLPTTALPIRTTPDVPFSGGDPFSVGGPFTAGDPPFAVPGSLPGPSDVTTADLLLGADDPTDAADEDVAPESQRRMRYLPSGQLLVAYLDWQPALCTTSQDRHGWSKAADVVRAGVNVLVWGFSHIDANNTLHFSPGNLTCAKSEVFDVLEREGLKATHEVSFGGWNTPFPENVRSGEQFARIFVEWNLRVRERYGIEFDGIDWDFEAREDSKGTNCSTAGRLPGSVE